MSLDLYVLLRYIVQKEKFEFIEYPPTVTDKDLVTTKRKRYTRTDFQIIRQLDFSPEGEVGINRDLHFSA